MEIILCYKQILTEFILKMVQIKLPALVTGDKSYYYTSMYNFRNWHICADEVIHEMKMRHDTATQ